MLSIIKNDKSKEVDAEAIDRLKEVISKFSSVQLAYLFDSYAEGREMSASVLEIAILMGRLLPYLTAEISNALNLPEERI